MNKEVVRKAVRGAILGELAFRIRGYYPDISKDASQLTDAVMRRLEALDPTELERPR